MLRCMLYHCNIYLLRRPYTQHYSGLRSMWFRYPCGSAIDGHMYLVLLSVAGQAAITRITRQVGSL